MTRFLLPSRRWFALFVFLAGSVLPVAAATNAHLVETYGKLPLQFEANQGQADKVATFLSHGSGYNVFLTDDEVVLAFVKRGKSLALHMRLVGAARQPLVHGLEELPGKANYFIGRDPAKWRTNVPTYTKVHYRDVYPGIDVVYHGNQGQLEYDFVVAAGANPKKIVLGFKGADQLEIDARGDLVLHAAGGDIRQHKPIVYQEIDGVRREIDGGYVLTGKNRVSFEVAAYDAGRPLIIDPVISYATYLGGNQGDSGRAIAVDVLGNAYVTGAAGDNFPTTPGALQTACVGGGFSGCANAFVTKLDPTGTALYSTYLGYAFGFGIAVDGVGNAYVTGSVNADGAATFPTTAGAFQPSFGGGSCGANGYTVLCRNAFVTKLDPTGSALIYSTFLGGSAIDEGHGIAVDILGNAYVTGSTSSPNFPATAGAFQTQHADEGRTGYFFDAFVTKLNATGSALAYSTYLGGLNDNAGYGIAVDAAGNAYVTGSTGPEFPTTPGVFQPTFGGYRDTFVTKLEPDGSALVYSTFLGGSRDDAGSGIAVDTLGNAYVTGSTQVFYPATSNDFPTTAGAFQSAFGGLGDAFVAKLNPTASALIYSTYLGGSSLEEAGYGIAADADGNAYVTGGTRSADFPTAGDAFQPGSTAGACSSDPLYRPSNAYVTKLDPTGSGLVYSAYLGGSEYDEGMGIALDLVGNAYVTGSTASNDFPTTPGAFQTTCGGGSSDVFVAKIVDSALQPLASTRSEESAATYSDSWATYGAEVGTFSGGTIVATNSAASPGVFSFTGTAVSWIGVKCNVCGIATVSIDGGAPSVVDTAGPGVPGSLTSEVVFSASGLAAGVGHTLAITVTGTTTSGGSYIAVDAFDVTR